MPKLFKRRSVVLFVLAGLAGLAGIAGIILPGVLPNNHAAPPAPIPAPVASASPSATSTKALPSADPGGQAAGEVVKLVVPTPSAADKTALAYLKDFHWETFVNALGATNGTKLTATQLAMPPVVFVTDLSGCPPGTGNKLSNTVNSAAAFCGGQIKLVSDKFNALSDADRLQAAASTFLYHALATTTSAQRKFNYNRPRTDAEMLGCLQASLSYAFERFGGGQPDDVWVVMAKTMNGGDVFSAYRAAMDFDGEWN